MQADKGQEDLSEQLREALGKLAEAEAQLRAAQDSATAAASDKEALFQRCAELEDLLSKAKVSALSSFRPISSIEAHLQGASLSCICTNR